MAEGYWCRKCKDFVGCVQGVFQHIHLGMKSCFLCPKCGTMVYMREKEKEAA